MGLSGIRRHKAAASGTALLLALGAAAALPSFDAAADGTAAAGTTYYVDASAGSDSQAGTSAATAWRTLGKVSAAALRPGDTVLFKRGEEWNGTLALSRSGTAGQPLTVGAYGTGERPVVGGGANCVWLTGSYWTVRDLRLTGCDWAGVEIEKGHHNTLEAIRADDNVVGVSIADTAHHNTVRGSELIDNNKMSVDDPGGDDDSGAFGVLLNGDDNLITGNTIAGSYATSHDYGYDGAAVEIYDGDRNRIEYNVTRDNETFTELGHDTDKTADGNVFAYNVVTSKYERGSFLVTRGPDTGLGPVRGTLVVNNSVYLPGAESQGWVCHGGCDTDILKLRNNVIAVGWKSGYEDGVGADEDTGVYDGSQHQFDAGPDSVFADPRFTGPDDLRVRAGSPAIGRGEPTGYTVDITGAPVPEEGATAGAYEYRP
ncbi:right-handed parallel beta-helix repeat-containing protein [Streptodolium elevatio]